MTPEEALRILRGSTDVAAVLAGKIVREEIERLQEKLALKSERARVLGVNLDATTDELGEARQELEQAKSALEACQPWTPQLLKQYVADTSDGFECLPGCDSHGHEDLCPVTNVVQAFRLLRERLEQAKERERQLREALGGLINAVKACTPALDNCCLISSIHGAPYAGPTWTKELEIAEAALTVPPAKEKP